MQLCLLTSACLCKEHSYQIKTLKRRSNYSIRSSGYAITEVDDTMEYRLFIDSVHALDKGGCDEPGFIGEDLASLINKGRALCIIELRGFQNYQRSLKSVEIRR